MALNVIWLNSKLNKPQDSIIRKADGHGLGVRISKTGKITFTFRYRFENKQTSVDLGSYPLMSIADARKKCLEYRTAIEEGKDPGALDSDKKQSLRTFKDFAEAWFEDYFRFTKQGNQVMRQLRTHLYPYMANIVVEESTTFDWMQKLKLAKKNTTLADGSFFTKVGRISQILTYATKHYKLKYNPAHGITGSDFNTKLNHRARVHSDDELRQIIKVLHHPKVRLEQRIFTYLTMLTGCRVAELNNSEIKDFNFDEMWWRIPVENSKNQDEFYRALTPFMVELIKLQIKTGKSTRFLFQARHDENKPYYRHSLQLLMKLRKLGQEMYPDFQTDWVMHDFRRSIRSRLGDWVSDKVAELSLGHRQTGVQAIYDRNKYLPQMREGYLKWEEHLRGLGLK